MLRETQDRGEIIPRVAALDIGKADLVCCVRVPGEGRAGRRLQEVRAYSTMTRSLLGMPGQLRWLGVTRVVMEATSGCWKPVFYVLEAAGFETWLVSAGDVKHVPGRPKSGKLGAVWLCKVAGRQMIWPGSGRASSASPSTPNAANAPTPTSSKPRLQSHPRTRRLTSTQTGPGSATAPPGAAARPPRLRFSD